MGNKPKLKKAAPQIRGMYFGDTLFKVGDVFRIRGEMFMVNNFLPEYGMMNMCRLTKAQHEEMLKQHNEAEKHARQQNPPKMKTEEEPDGQEEQSNIKEIPPPAGDKPAEGAGDTLDPFSL